MTKGNPPEAKESTSFWNTTLGTIAKITALLTAITGLILAVKPLLKDKTDTNTSSQQVEDVAGGKPAQKIINSPPAPVINYSNIAQDLATKWYSAFEGSDIDYLVSVSDPPLYAHHNYLLSKDDIRSFYRSLIDGNNGAGGKAIKADIFKAGTVAEFKSSGFSGKYLDINKLGLSDTDDYYVQAGESEREGGGLILLFKKDGQTLKLIGLLMS